MSADYVLPSWRGRSHARRRVTLGAALAVTLASLPLFAPPMTLAGQSDYQEGTGPWSGTCANPGNAVTSNDLRADCAENQSVVGSGFGLQALVPADAVGISFTVLIEGQTSKVGPSPNHRFDVSFSGDGGANYTAITQTGQFKTTSDVSRYAPETQACSEFGPTWSFAEISDANFRVMVTAKPSPTTVGPNPVTLRIDDIDVRACWAPKVNSIDRAISSPSGATSVSWTVTFAESVSGVDVSDFSLVETGVTGASITGVTPAGPASAYTVTAGTGTGDGTLGLNLSDDDSIVSSGGIPLGGTGAGNGNFTGQVYEIDKTPPVVQSIDPSGASPTNAASVSWTVVFSENVTGVGTGDFALATTGAITGASVTGVAPVDSKTYTVDGSTGAGDGSLGLNLVDDDSITDAAGTVLGGAGAGNGSFTGEVYDIDKTPPGTPTVLVTPSLVNASNQGAVTVSGSAEPGSTVDISVDDADGGTSPVAGAATADPVTGAYSKILDLSTLSDGAITATVIATDAAGNASLVPGVGAATKDAGVPATPTIELDAGSDSGASNSDNITNVSAPAFNGSAEANSTIRVYSGLTLLGTTAADGAGSWSFTVPGGSPLADGLHSITATATDSHGNISLPSVALGLTIDTQAPNDPTGLESVSHVVGVALSDATIDMTWVAALDNGLAGVDGYGYAFTDTSSGSCPQVKLLAAPETSVSSSTLADGSWWFHICTLDLAGNWTSTESAGPSVIDLTPPDTPALVSPADGVLLETTPSFNWDDVADPSGVSYQVQIDSGLCSFTSPSIDVGGLASSAFTPSSPLAEGNYCWRVRAVDGASNSSGWSGTRAFTIDINELPVAQDDVADTGPSTAVTINVVANDSDPDGTLDPSTLVIVSGPSNGLASITGPGQISYLPAFGFLGLDTFAYRICDDRGACDVATASIVVAGVQGLVDEIGPVASTQLGEPTVEDGETGTAGGSAGTTEAAESASEGAEEGAGQLGAASPSGSGEDSQVAEVELAVPAGLDDDAVFGWINVLLWGVLAAVVVFLFFTLTRRPRFE